MDGVASFRRHGWLHVPGALEETRLRSIDDAVRRLTASATSGVGMHHHEQTDAGAVLARSEDFVDSDPVFGDLLRGDPVVSLLEPLFGEPPVLFKEKVNYKHPGGGGFAPHQDAAAYRFVDHHISVMVPLDPATEASGCLWVATGFERGMLPTDGRGRIDPALAATLDWRSVPLDPGDLLLFDSHTPHYSETNRTERSRRALYLTYNAASAGDHRAEYYADKRAEFARVGADVDGERVRLSISDDFLGRPVGT